MTCRQRDDITLLLRNFSFQLTPTSATNTLRSLYGTYNLSGGGDSMMIRANTSGWNDTLTEGASLTSSESSEQPKSGQSLNAVIDEEGRIGPYVDFTNFYQAVHKAKEDGTIPQDAVY